MKIMREFNKKKPRRASSFDADRPRKAKETCKSNVKDTLVGKRNSKKSPSSSAANPKADSKVQKPTKLVQVK